MDTPRMTDDQIGPPALPDVARAARRDDRPQLPPRPLWRPPVSPVEAGTFGRPRGVDGAFGPDAPRVNGAAQQGIGPGISTAPPVPEFLEDAFGRPVGGGDSIGREPAQPEPPGHSESAPSDPWRDPMSGAQLGAPAIDPTPPEGPAPLPAERFSFRQALFDRRLRPSALIGLLVCALLIGALGALIGVIAAGRLPRGVTDPDFTLAAAQPSVSRGPGSIADVAARVLPSVVSLEIRTGDVGDTGSGVVIDPVSYTHLTLPTKRIV